MRKIYLVFGVIFTLIPALFSFSYAATVSLETGFIRLVHGDRRLPNGKLQSRIVYVFESDQRLRLLKLDKNVLDLAGGYAAIQGRRLRG